MAVAYESKTGVTLSLNATPQTITLPSGTAEGELLIVHWTQNGASGATTVFQVSGGTSLVTAVMYHNSDGYHSSGAIYKYATSTDISNGYISVNGSDSFSITARINVYRISGEVASLTATGDFVVGDSTPSYNVTQTPLIDNSLLLIMAACSQSSTEPNGSAYAIATDNPTWTEATDERIVNMGGSTDDPSIFMAYTTRTEQTATGDASMAMDGSRSFGILVCVNPASPASPSAGVGDVVVQGQTSTTGPSGQMFSDHDSFLVQGENITLIPDNFTDIEFNITIKAVDSIDGTILSYVGTPTITSTGTLVTGSGVTDPFVLGVLTQHAVEFSNSGAFTITATDGAIAGTSNSFDIFSLTYMQNHKGDIFYPVKILPTLSNVKHINIIMAPVAGISGTKKEAAIKFYFNMSSTPAYTKYITRDDIAKGYVSYEINKPYVNSIQMEVEYYNSSNLNPDGLYSTSGEADFCPAYAEIIYERTDTIR